MKDAKIMLLIKNVDVELAEKIQKLINEYNARKSLAKRVEDGKA